MRILAITDAGLNIARRLSAEGRKLGHRVDVSRMEEITFVVGPGRPRVLLKGADVFRKYDILYLGYFYPYISEALLLAEWAAAAGLKVVDRALVDRNFVQNKMYDYWKLERAGLPTPGGFQAMKLKNALGPLARAKWPVVAKGVHGAQGRFVFKVGNRREALKYLSDDLVGFFLFQDYLPIEEEYRVITIGYRAIGAMRKGAAPGDFRHNIAVGGTGAKVSLPPKLLRLCEKASRALRHEFAGIDLAISGGKPYILEVNRRPGIGGFEKATGINVARAFIEYVTQDRHRRTA